MRGLTDGGWVIVWDDDTIDGIRLTRYDSTGAVVAGQSEVQVETETQSNQDQPHVVGLDNGGYVVTWVSDNSGTAGDGSGDGVFAQLFNAAGARVGGEIAVNQQTIGTQDSPTVTDLNGGRFAVAWRDADGTNGDGSGSSVAARVFDNTGVAATNQFQVNSFTAGEQTQPQIGTLAGGNIVVAWRSEGQDGSSGGIYYQIFTDAGTPVGGEVRVNDLNSGNQTNPNLITLDTGGFVIGWTDTSTPAPGTGSGVFVQVFDADGTRVDGERRVNSEVDGEQNDIRLTALPNGNYVVQWTSQTSGTAGDGSSNGVFQQIFGDPAEIQQSAAPVLEGLEQIVTLEESAVNAGALLAETGALSLSDLDSADLDGGVIRLTRVVTDPVSNGFLAPDDQTQDSVFITVGGAVTQSGSTLRVDGVDVATLVSGGANGAVLELDLLAGATLDRVETLLSALTYQNDSDDPRVSRTYSLLIEDGDGGLTQPRAIEIRVTDTPEVGAPVAVGGDTQVNTFTTSDQDDPEVTTLTDGGWVVVWRSNQDGDGDGIFGQRYDSEGARVGGEFRVNTEDRASQRDPVVTALEDGGWVVAWESNFVDDPNVNDTGILAQRYNADGTRAGTETVVNTITASTQQDPAIATIPTGTAGFANGGYVVVYTSDSGDGSSDSILMSRFATDGTQVGTEQVANGPTISGNQGLADVAVLSNGLIAVTYFSGDDLFLRVFNPDGTEALAEQLVSGTATNSDIAATSNGFVIGWTDTSGLDGSGQGIVAQRYDLTGAAVEGSFVVNEVFSNTQSEVDVIGLDDGRFVVAWHETSNGLDGSGDSAQAQVFSATGERLDSQFTINQQTNLSNQFQPQLAALPGGNFVGVFTSLTSGADGDGSGHGVFQTIFGNPADFAPGAAPILQGVPDAVTLAETDVNSGLQRLDADKTIALGDLDSADFDTGVLSVRVAENFNKLEQLNTGDDDSQDTLGLVAGDVGNGDVQFSGFGIGDTVSVNGTTIGTITSSGTQFDITFNSDATVERVEAVLGNLAYANGSGAPAPLRRVSIDISDGDGLSAQTQFIDVSVTAEDDVALTASADRRVNAHTQSTQSQPEVIELTGGGMVVVWTSANQDNLNVEGSNGVFAQMYDASGEPVGREFQINSFTDRDQSQPDIAATDDGGFVVVWQSSHQDQPGSSQTGIYGQRFDAAGQPNGAEFQVNTAVPASQFAPSVAAYEGADLLSHIRPTMATAALTRSSANASMARLRPSGSRPRSIPSTPKAIKASRMWRVWWTARATMPGISSCSQRLRRAATGMATETASLRSGSIRRAWQPGRNSRSIPQQLTTSRSPR